MQASHTSPAASTNATPKTPDEASTGANLDWGRILLFVGIVIPLLVGIVLMDRCG